MRPGVSGREIDRVAREVIEDAGYGEYFPPHRPRAGAGSPETPDMSQVNDASIAPGNVFSPLSRVSI